MVEYSAADFLMDTRNMHEKNLEINTFCDAKIVIADLDESPI